MTYSKRTKELLFLIIRNTLTGKFDELPSDFEQYTDEILSMSNSQDVYQLTYWGIKKSNGKLPSESHSVAASYLFQHSQNAYVLRLTKDCLGSERIPFIVLKGDIVRKLYPFPWLRHSCDIDVLVKEKDLNRATQALVQAGFITNHRKKYHDISFYYEGVHLELHFNICEGITKADKILKKVWSYSKQIDNYEYQEVPAFFTFHCLVHVLYHFIRGECSIKQFVDLWILRKEEFYKEEELMTFLEQSKLETFYEVISMLLGAWFEGKPTTDRLIKIENQVMNGGLINTDLYTDEINIVMSGGKANYLWKVTFLPYSQMKWIYPVLEKKPLLLPLYYLKRIWCKVFGKDRYRSRHVLKTSGSEESEIIKLLNDMGIN